MIEGYGTPNGHPSSHGCQATENDHNSGLGPADCVGDHADSCEKPNPGKQSFQAPDNVEKGHRFGDSRTTSASWTRPTLRFTLTWWCQRNFRDESVSNYVELDFRGQSGAPGAAIFPMSRTRLVISRAGSQNEVPGIDGQPSRRVKPPPARSRKIDLAPGM